MEVKQDPRIFLNAQDINEIYRTLGGKSVALEDGRRVSFEIEMRQARNNDENFANEMVSRLIKDANTESVTDALVSAVRSSGSDWTENEVETLVAVLNEKFGSGLNRADFMLSEEFARDEEITELFDSGDEDNMWTNEQVEEFMDGLEEELQEDFEREVSKNEDEGGSMLDQFDPNDGVKQEVAMTIEREIGLSDELSMEIADTLREADLLKETDEE